jgi:amino-acid N-acetyltransferase
VRCRAASREDAARIVDLLTANRDDPSMFLRSQSDVTAHLADFLVAEDEQHLIAGCAALHQHRPWLAELLSVAVDPALQGLGVGSALVRESLRQADQRAGLERVFLATAKPEYFGRFGFEPVSKWVLPAGVLVDKLTNVLAQPIRRWIPALWGRHTFMAWRAR